MEQYDQILCFLVPIVAIYCIYLWVSQFIFRKLPPFHLLLPKGANAANCKNIERFFVESSPYILMLAMISGLFGFIDVCAIFLKNVVPGWLQYVSLIGYVVFLAIFSQAFRKITEKYWPDVKF